MRCKQVDLLNNTVSLYSGETKNDEGRTVVLTEECRQLVMELRKGKESENFLFTRADGSAVRDFRNEWEKLCCGLGLGQMICHQCLKPVANNRKCETCPGRRRLKYRGLLFHDQRRSAVRNMIRRGVPQKTAREISGHKTDSVFNRYNIVNEADIAEAAKKIEAGAKAALEQVIHSSFIVAPNQGNQEDRQAKGKPA